MGVDDRPVERVAHVWTALILFALGSVYAYDQDSSEGWVLRATVFGLLFVAVWGFVWLIMLIPRRTPGPIQIVIFYAIEAAVALTLWAMFL